MTTVPSTYQNYGSENGNRQFLMPGHSVSAPRVLSVRRKNPTLNGNGEFSLPLYELKFTVGHVDSEGKPLKQRSHITLTVQHPVGADQTAVNTAIDDLVTVISQASFKDDAMVDLMYPDVASV
nr:MAG: coat protein [Leviviridae sp.]